MKLPEEYRTAMDEADENRPEFENGEFEALPDGYYLAKVESIDLSPSAGKSGFKQWIVVWRIMRPRAFAKRTQWERYSLSPKAAWKMRELYDALGYEYDSDSSELIGEKAILEIFQEPIETGKRKGQMGNSVEKVMDADDADYLKLIGK